MKNIIKKTVLLLAIILINSCSSDNDNSTEQEQSIPEQATIESYSNNYGYSGDNIIISGTNFTNNLNDVTVSFDGVNAIVNSVTTQQINITLPITGNSLPALNVEIENKFIVNNVQNDYNKNIGILANTPNEWHKINHNAPFGYIYKSQSIGQDKFYFSTSDSGGSGVYRTQDGGLTWNNWGRCGFYGAFYATSNDEGWTQTTFGVNKVPVGGSSSLNSDVHPSTSTIGLYVNDLLTNGFLISQEKVVFETTNGTTFTEVYNNTPPTNNSSKVSVFSELNENHMWAGGYIEVNTNFDAPLILYLDNGIWDERTIPGLATSSQVNQIQFINEDKGYLYVKNKGTSSSVLNQLYKSIDGGNSWQLLYNSNNISITSFNFKNETIGWFCSENKIYKTIDGGINWTIDYTHNSDIGNVTYNDGVVWAMTSDKILKYFTE